MIEISSRNYLNFGQKPNNEPILEKLFEQPQLILKGIALLHSVLFYE
jgi:hypothetical protein